MITLDIYHVRSPKLNHLGGHQLGASTIAVRACHVSTVVYYDWIKLEGLELPIRLPVLERIITKMPGYPDLWHADMSWTNYKEIRADHKVNEFRFSRNVWPFTNQKDQEG